MTPMAGAATKLGSRPWLMAIPPATAPIAGVYG
jgi:hypothetical protein